MANDKWILIVDDEEAILAVLQKSLAKLGSDYHVATATDGYSALNQLQQHEFDLVVTDYKMAGMNGLELLETVRELQPAARMILMTAFGSETIETEAIRLQTYRYLTKPLEIDTFRQIVKEALGETPVARAEVLILTDETYRKIVDMLSQLQSNIGARCLFLADAEGHFIAKVGEVDNNLSLEQVAALVGGSMATLSEAGRVIDGETDTINLSYREGKRENLYVVNIGLRLLLIIVIDRGPYSSRLGSVWYYAQQAAQSLQETIGHAEYGNPQQVFSGDLGKAVEERMDQLFDGLDTPFEPETKISTIKPAEPIPDPKPTPPPAAKASSEVKTIPVKQNQVMTFEQAKAAGLFDNK